MPQLIPFYFVNDYSRLIVSLSLITYIMSQYVLPAILRRQIRRIAIVKV